MVDDATTLKQHATAIDAALVALADEYVRYAARFRDAGGTGKNLEREGASPQRLAEAIIRRARDLGLDPVLHAARTPGRTGPEWVQHLHDRIDQVIA
jgi:hypothetical protein